MQTTVSDDQKQDECLLSVIFVVIRFQFTKNNDDSKHHRSLSWLGIGKEYKPHGTVLTDSTGSRAIKSFAHA